MPSLALLWSVDYRPSKRHLAMVLIVGGLLTIAGLLALDLVGGGREGGIGPAQRAALLASGLGVVIGGLLLPLRAPVAEDFSRESLSPPVYRPIVARLHTALMLLASIVLVYALLVLLVYAANLMSFPFDYDQGEGFELVDSILFSQFRLPYLNAEEFPFYSSNYPPFFHVMAAPFVWVFGPQYWYGRLLGLLMTLLGAGFIGYAVRREGSSRWLAALMSLAFLSSNTVYHIAPLFRQHISMVTLEIMAVVLLAHTFPRRQARLILLAVLLLILAGYTKQLAAYTAIAVILWMGLVNPRRALVWTTFFGLVGVTIFAWLTWATQGEWWRQAIQANANAISYPQVFALLELFWKLHGFLLVPAALNIAYELAYSRVSLYSVWGLTTLALGGISSGTWGGGDSYFATSIAASCILSGLFFSRLLRGHWHEGETPLLRLLARPLLVHVSKLRSAAALIVPLTLLGYGIATFKTPTDGPFFGTIAQILNIQSNVMGRFYDSATWNVGGYARIGYLVTQEDIDNGWRIVERARQAEGLVLSEEAGFSLRAGREVITNPTQLLNLYNAGLFQGDGLLRLIDNRAFGLVILRAQFYPTPVLIALATHYERAETIPMNGFDYVLLRPR
ncbi:MAG: hypothetical protein NZ750_00400 [Anaerolineae bacterium]|nr:hypothetical protein [Anaerolineae bacterium]MDW8173045.1 hypothetical protein [Anaerolineae bacterium]